MTVVKLARSICLAATVAALGALLVTPVSTGNESATRLIDRTVVCQMPGEGYPDVTRFMTVSALGPPPLMFVSNGPSYDLRVQLRTRASGREPTGAATLNREACTASMRRVLFSTQGLRRPRGRSSTCDVPATVLVRFRARFARPTGWVRDRETPSLIHAQGTISTGSMMVTTLSGRAVAFASVTPTRSTLFTSRSLCH